MNEASLPLSYGEVLVIALEKRVWSDMLLSESLMRNRIPTSSLVHSSPFGNVLVYYVF
jgi:hypothetical protein